MKLRSEGDLSLSAVTLLVAAQLLRAVLTCVQVAGNTSHETLRLCTSGQREREFFIENLPVRIHLIIEMIWWTGLAPWVFEIPFAGSLISTFLPQDKAIWRAVPGELGQRQEDGAGSGGLPAG